MSAFARTSHFFAFGKLWIGEMNWNTVTVLRALCGAGLIAGAVGTAMAHGDATGVVADRMNGMMDMARSIKQLTEAIDAGAAEPLIVEQAAETIRRHAGETMVVLFPQGSLDAPSEASPAIWENWQEFTGLAHRLHELGGELARPHRSGDSRRRRTCVGSRTQNRRKHLGLARRACAARPPTETGGTVETGVGHGARSSVPDRDPRRDHRHLLAVP